MAERIQDDGLSARNVLNVLQESSNAGMRQSLAESLPTAVLNGEQFDQGGQY